MTLFFGLVFGMIGSAFMLYAKKQHEVLPLIVGFALVIYPYFIDNPVLVVAIGICLCAIPLAHQRGWL